jgi:protein-S-isoprenylcysteine O-methyltransferase Ste14
VWRQLRAILPLPGMAVVIVPAVILLLGAGPDPGWGLDGPLAALPVLLGIALFAFGFSLFVRTVTLFARVGEGTLAPWDPPKRFVAEGPYRRWRHPMITGVLFMLLGEAAGFGSISLLAWAAAFIAVNAVYLPLVEEPRLVRRFGREYEDYMRRVPRWLPR